MKFRWDWQENPNTIWASPKGEKRSAHSLVLTYFYHLWYVARFRGKMEAGAFEKLLTWADNVVPDHTPLVDNPLRIGQPLNVGATPPYIPAPLPKGKMCGWKDERCKYCFGTGYVHESLYTAYDQERSAWDALVPALGPAVTQTEGARIASRNRRSSALPMQIAEDMRSAIATSDARLKPVKSAFPYNGGPFLPWHSGPPSATPAVTFGVDSPKLDILYAHDDCVHRDQVFGSFCGEPIVWLDELGMEVNEERELVNRVAVSSGTSIPAEILPGEERCADGIIRHTTTAEAQGDVYYNREFTETGQKRVSIAEGREAAQEGYMVYFRPDGRVGEGEYTLVEEEK